MKYIYGLDFGTSNSTLSILELSKRKVVKTFSVPSLLYFPDKQSKKYPLIHYVGNDAVNKYIENSMTGRFMKSIKRVLPKTTFVSTSVYGHEMKAEDLVALILDNLKKQADNFCQSNITTVVLGRPVLFDNDIDKDKLAQERLFSAAKLCGFEQIYIEAEPIAAALAYLTQLKKKEIVLIGDLGGGTSDFSLISLDPEYLNNPGQKVEIFSKGGIYIGGDNFDEDIMWARVVEHFGYGVQFESYGTMLPLPKSFFLNICSWQKMNFFNSQKVKLALKKFHFQADKNPKFGRLITFVENNLGYALHKRIENSKIELSSIDITNVEFEYLDINIHESISIDQFNNIINKDVLKIENYLDIFLQESSLNLGQIESVFLTGGTSMVRRIRSVFSNRFGESKIATGDNFNSVAEGLAYSYIILQGSPD